MPFFYWVCFSRFTLTVLPNRNNRNDYFSVLQKENKKATQHKSGLIAHPFWPLPFRKGWQFDSFFFPRFLESEGPSENKTHFCCFVEDSVQCPRWWRVFPNTQKLLSVQCVFATRWWRAEFFCAEFLLGCSSPRTHTGGCAERQLEYQSYEVLKIFYDFNTFTFCILLDARPAKSKHLNEIARGFSRSGCPYPEHKTRGPFSPCLVILSFLQNLFVFAFLFFLLSFFSKRKRQGAQEKQQTASEPPHNTRRRQGRGNKEMVRVWRFGGAFCPACM